MRSPALAAVVVALVVVPQAASDACTTAVIAGCATADGRPILWKNRDTENRNNQVVLGTDGRYRYLGVVNGGDALPLEIWAGINEVGFAIMNSASYNLDDIESEAEGMLMKLALQSCRTAAEFQAVLERTNETGRDVTANFGVIDAEGEAAYFETGPHAFVRFDATDPKLGSKGFLVRTNFSESGDPNLGSGLLRLRRATALLDREMAAGRLTAETLLRTVSRDIANERLMSFPLTAAAAPTWAFVADSICRQDKDAATEAAAVFAGVRKGEDPRLATMWVIPGIPVTGVATPLWVAAGAVPTELAVGTTASPLGDACERVRAVVFPERRGDLKKYLNVAALTEPRRGVLTPLLDREAANFRAAEAALEGWRRALPASGELAAVQARLAADTLAALKAVTSAGTGETTPR